MKTSLLGELCSKLLLTHNRVSLPGMGSFMAEELPARIQKKGHIIVPPSRRISFKTTETWNDGLLEKSYARYAHISVSEAKEKLRITVENIKESLNRNHVVQIENLGTLQSSASGKILFTSNRKDDLYPEGFGLKPLPICPLERLNEQRTKEPGVSPQQSKAKQTRKKRIWPYCLVLVTGLILFLIFLVYLFC